MEGASGGSITQNAANFRFNYASGGAIEFRDAVGLEYNFGSTLANWQGNDLITMGVLSFDDADTSLQQSSINLELDVASGGNIVFRINDSQEYSFNATSVNFGNSTLSQVANITFADDTGHQINNTASQMQFEVSVGDDFAFQVAGVDEYTFDATQADFLGNNLTGVSILTITSQMNLSSGNSLIWAGNANRRLTNATTGFEFEVETGDTFNYEINSVLEYSYSATTADFNGNNIQDISNILDSNGNQLLTFTTTASAVNELTLVNAATANAVELQASGNDTDIDVRFVPKGTGTFFGARETWAWPLTDETTLPTTGVKYTTEPAPYDMSIDDAIAGLTTAGTGGIQATGTVTCLSVLIGDTVTVNGLLYTGVTGLKADDTEFSVDSGDNATATDLADSISNDTRTGTDEATVDQTAIAVTNVVTITASVFGIIGNNVGLSSSDGVTLAVSGANLAGGIDLFTIDVLKETGVNSDSFTSIFSTLLTIDSSEFTSTTATATPVLSVTTWEKGRRLQLSISAVDADALSRGVKIELITHATAK